MNEIPAIVRRGGLADRPDYGPAHHRAPASPGHGRRDRAAVALFGSTALGAPVSTTHTVAGAVTGVGAVTPGGCR
jgi:hypothetical protein